MHIKLDENIPAALRFLFNQYGHEVDTVADEGLIGEHDDRVWAEAVQEKRFFVTQDLDFSDIRKYAPGSHSGVLILRLDHPSRLALVRRVEHILKHEDFES